MKTEAHILAMNTNRLLFGPTSMMDNPSLQECHSLTPALMRKAELFTVSSIGKALAVQLGRHQDCGSKLVGIFQVDTTIAFRHYSDKMLLLHRL